MPITAFAVFIGTGYLVSFWAMSTTAQSPSKAAVRPLRILVADDHPIVRKTVRSILEQHPRFEVCGEVGDGSSAVEEAVRSKPDVVVLNVEMPVLNGIEAAREIKKKLPELAIVILSTHAARIFVEAARKAGARAYVSKTSAGTALVKAIEAATAGGDFVLIK